MTPAKHLSMAIPSKGALYKSTMSLLERCHLDITRDAAGRSYNGRVADLDGATVLYSRADEIPAVVATGNVLMGITGLDLFNEGQLTRPNPALRLIKEDLGYGSAGLDVGVPESWIDVRSMADLVDVAHDIRQRHSRPLLVATKFPGLTRRHFIRHGLTDYRIVQSLGATEAAPRAGSADIVVDLVSSGATFDANGLTKIDDGLVLQSQACLIALATPSAWSATAASQFRHVIDLIDAARRAQLLRSVRLTYPKSMEALPSGLESLLDDVRIRKLETGISEIVANFARRDIHQVLAAAKSSGAVDAAVAEAELMARLDKSSIADFLNEITDSTD